MKSPTLFLLLAFLGINVNCLFAEWTPVGELPVSRIDALLFRENILFAGTYDGGIFRSFNNGIDWDQANNNLSNTHVMCLTNCGQYLFAGTYGGGVFRSEDNGTTWTQINEGLTSLKINSFAVEGINIFVGTVGGGVFYSSNFGMSWTPRNVGLPILNIIELAINGTNLLASTVGGGIFRSTNNGATWTQSNTGLTTYYVKSFAVKRDNGITNIFAGTGDGVFVSGDNGLNWRQLAGIPQNTVILSLSFWGTYLFAGAQGGGIYIYDKNSVSWTQDNTGLTNLFILSLAAQDIDIYAGTNGGGVFKLKTDDYFVTGKIIFTSNRTGYSDIFSVLPNGESLLNLTNTADAEEFGASWSPDGNEILYVSNPMDNPGDTFGWDMKLIVMNQNGTNSKILDQDAPILEAHWSPSGNRIVYLRGMPSNLYSVNRNIDGTWGAAQLICSQTLELNNIYTRFSFYGEDYIIFDRMCPLSIYRLNLSNCAIEEFEPDHDNIQYDPDVTADGKIVFVRMQGSVQSLYEKESFQLGSVKILNNTQPFPRCASWSHNKKYISFWSDVGTGPIKIYNTSTYEVTTMNSTNSVKGWQPSSFEQRWSPKDDKIVLTGMGKGASDYSNDEIYVLDINNDEILNISYNIGAVDYEPRWQPVEQDILLQKIIVTSPNGGESLPGGLVKNITWISQNISYVKLEYSINNGTSWKSIIDSTPASSGKYSWAVPNVSSNLCLVRISDKIDGCPLNQSNTVFTIVKRSVNVISPNGGETWIAGSVQNIAWESEGLENIKLEYSTRGVWSPIIDSYPANLANYSWTVPDKLSNQCLVRISDANDKQIWDRSDNEFRIRSRFLKVTSPNGGEIWIVRETQKITWLSQNVSNVKIDYSRDSGATWISIVKSTPADLGSYSWIVADHPSSTCLVRISDVEQGWYRDKSDKVFTIKRQIK